jgi:hypothetical protein
MTDNANQDNRENPPSDFPALVYQLSAAAFELAQEAAASQAKQNERARRAREINDFLNELVPYIQNAPLEEQEGLRTAWTDARLDVGYVLSGGELPTSTRLFHYLEGIKPEE